MIEVKGLTDPRLDGLSHEVVRHGRVSSLEEAAEARGVSPSQVIKTMVVRKTAGNYLFVLVPGDRVISWPKLRHHLGVSRLSMPDAEEAREVTGYARGSITPLGSLRQLPVIADERIRGDVSLGAGVPGVAITVSGEALISSLDAVVADVTDPV
ncbi:MAG: aminoacyl-tRNA deacylase [Acidimicrobiia bacterium]